MDSAQAGVAAAEKQVEAAASQVVEAKADALKLNTDVQRYQQLLTQARDLATAVRCGNGGGNRCQCDGAGS